jgi:formyl-CoA transferase
MAVGNDRQWKALVSQKAFQSLDKQAYEKNAGRINDVTNLNEKINEITKHFTSEEIIELLHTITVPVSKISDLTEVIQDPLVKKLLLHTTDPVSSKEITLAPPPHMTPYLEKNDRTLSFPPRFGEHNREIYGDVLGYADEAMSDLRKRGII